MKKMIMTWLCVSLFSFCSCQKDLIEYEAGDIKVCIEESEKRGTSTLVLFTRGEV